MSLTVIAGRIDRRITTRSRDRHAGRPSDLGRPRRFGRILSTAATATHRAVGGPRADIRDGAAADSPAPNQDRVNRDAQRHDPESRYRGSGSGAPGRHVAGAISGWSTSPHAKIAIGLRVRSAQRGRQLRISHEQAVFRPDAGRHPAANCLAGDDRNVSSNSNDPGGRCRHVGASRARDCDVPTRNRGRTCQQHAMLRVGQKSASIARRRHGGSGMARLAHTVLRNALFAILALAATRARRFRRAPPSRSTCCWSSPPTCRAASTPPSSSSSARATPPRCRTAA